MIFAEPTHWKLMNGAWSIGISDLADEWTDESKDWQCPNLILFMGDRVGKLSHLATSAQRSFGYVFQECLSQGILKKTPLTYM